MKALKYILTLVVIVASTLTYAQSNFINYQGLASDSNGDELQNQTITIGIAIKFGTPIATADYEETHSVTTNNLGVFSLQIGNGTVVSGDYNTLIWDNNAFVTTSINGTEVGTTELHAVPFALNSGDSVWQKNGNDISNKNSGNIGIGTNTPLTKLHVNDGAIRVDRGSHIIGINPNYGLANTHATIGTASNIPLRLQVNSDDKISILNNGNVGIGTTTPNGKLDVRGDIWLGEQNTGTYKIGKYISNVISSNYIEFGAQGSPIDNYIKFHTHLGGVTQQDVIMLTGSGNVGIGTNTPTTKLDINGQTKIQDLSGFTATDNILVADVDGVLHNSGITVSNISDGKFIDGTNPNDAVYTTGNVGIGTTAPMSKLDIVENADGGEYKSAITFQDGGGDTDFWMARKEEGSAPGGDGLKNDKFVIGKGNVAGTDPYFAIDSNGNVGIGTTNPINKLQIHDNTTGASNNVQLTLTNGDTGETGGNGFTISLGNDETANIVNRENTDMVFKTNDIERLRIGNTGNVGIGIPSGTNKVEIGGTAFGQYGLSVDDDGFGRGIQIIAPNFTYLSTGNSMQMGSSLSNVLNSSYIMAHKDGKGDFNDLVFNPYGGNIGIGTTIPTAKLHIENTNGNDIVRIGDGNDWAMLELHGSGSSNSQIRQGAAADGLQLFAGDQIEFWVNTDATPLQAMEIMTNGNVGIGIASPNSKLHIDNSDNATAWSTQIVTGNNSGLLVDGSSIPSTNRVFQASNGAGTEMVVLGNGNAGIGTTNPTSKLEVVGGDGTQIVVSGGTGSSSTGYVLRAGQTYGENYITFDGERLAIGSDPSNASAFPSTEALTILKNGNIGIGTASPNVKLDVQGIVNIGTGAEGVLTYDATKFIVKANNGEYLSLGANGQNDNMVIDTSGNVGIGTNSPQATMHINGFMKLEPQNVAPTSPTKGMIYYDNNTNKIKVYTGSQWEALGFL